MARASAPLLEATNPRASSLCSWFGSVKSRDTVSELKAKSCLLSSSGSSRRNWWGCYRSRKPGTLHPWLSLVIQGACSTESCKIESQDRAREGDEERRRRKEKGEHRQKLEKKKG
ncbi:hypothetical protein V6N13_077280 [Hibiscus sabdariffa]